MSLTKEEMMNEDLDAGLITLAAVGVSFASRKVIKDGLGVPSNTQGVLKLAAAIAGGLMLVQFIQKKKWLPDDPFKKKSST